MKIHRALLLSASLAIGAEESFYKAPSLFSTAPDEKNFLTTIARFEVEQWAVFETSFTSGRTLLRHGFLRVAKNQRHFEHADGTPFLWLADTWWKNLCKRMTWEGFQKLTADRKAKGFNAIQIVCGPYPPRRTGSWCWNK